MSAPPTIMLHDGECPLCEKEVCHYRRIANPETLDLVDVHSTCGADILSAHQLTKEQALRRLHVITPEEKAVDGADAFIAVWRVLPGWKRLVPVASFWPIKLVMEGLYRLFVPLRPRLSAWMARRVTV